MEISTWRQRHPTPISSNNPTVSKYLQVWSFSILSPPCAHSNTVNLETSNTWIWNERNNRSTTQDLVEDQVIFQAFNEVLGICSMMTAFFLVNSLRRRKNLVCSSRQSLATTFLYPHGSPWSTPSSQPPDAPGCCHLQLGPNNGRLIPQLGHIHYLSQYLFSGLPKTHTSVWIAH